MSAANKLEADAKKDPAQKAELHSVHFLVCHKSCPITGQLPPLTVGTAVSLADGLETK